jgi:catechol 2,3-dioxygenase-like lactoylglutathione lyase family enzyme
MTYFQGRLINHIHLRVSDLERSRRFYRAVIGGLGLASALNEKVDCFWVDELYVDQADDYVSRVHIAFQASSREAVHRFFKAALAHGGTDNGKPGPRHYHSHYYAAFVLDPDGNNIEAVCEEPTRRSSDAVVVERTPAV